MSEICKDDWSAFGDSLGARIDELRKRLGSVREALSVRGLAAEISTAVGRYTNPTSVERWNKGRAVPDAYDVIGLAKLAKTSVESFMAGLSAPAVKRRSKPKRRAATVPQVKPPPKSVTRVTETGAKPRRRAAEG